MKEKVIAVILEVMDENDKVYDGDILMTSSFRDDLNFDSFDLALLTVKIEDEFDVDIFEDGAIDSLEQLIDKLQ
jgi:acyl carrier protein